MHGVGASTTHSLLTAEADSAGVVDLSPVGAAQVGAQARLVPGQPGGADWPTSKRSARRGVGRATRSSLPTARRSRAPARRGPPRVCTGPRRYGSGAALAFVSLREIPAVLTRFLDHLARPNARSRPKQIPRSNYS